MIYLKGSVTMRDFTLPDDANLRGIRVVSYERELDETLAMIDARKGDDNQSAEVSSEEEGAVLIERARDANRIAFELLFNGVIDEERQQSIFKACEPYLPKRTYSRSSLAMPSSARPSIEV
jgi:hypothetical protein